MTEAEWLTCQNVETMLIQCQGYKSKRKMRLLACACCRAVRQHIDSPALIAGIEVSEEFADDPTKRAQIHAQMQQNQRFMAQLRASIASTSTPYDPIRLACTSEAAQAASAHDAIVCGVPNRINVALPEQISVSCDLVRCIFGNPFRPVDFDPAWRTDTVVAGARGMYARRDFAEMPILADALQDAGCEDEQVLMHCRQPGAHTRGCWVVDTVMGKE